MHPAYFEDRWADLRRRTRLLRGSWLAAAALGLGGGYLSAVLDWPWVFYSSAGLGGLLLIAAFNYRLAFPCPGCDKQFFSFSFGSNSLAGKCVHCGRQAGCTV